jgi:CRISPR-associated endonuclease/helicase Cas3
MTSTPDRVYYAHSRPGEPSETWERLEWHLRRAGALARRFGRRFGAGVTAGASGLLHDVGKYSDAFQHYIAKDAGRVDHATGGAREAVKVYGKEIGRLLAYGIAGHHAGLPNGGNADEGALLSRLESKRIPLGHDRWNGRVSLPQTAAVAAELAAFVGSNQTTFDRFSKTFLARMIFSCLVDAHFFCDGMVLRPWQIPRSPTATRSRSACLGAPRAFG